MAMSQPGPAEVSSEVLGNAKQLEVILSSKMSGISYNAEGITESMSGVMPPKGAVSSGTGH